MDRMNEINTATRITTPDVNALELALMAARKDLDVVSYVMPYGIDHTQALRTGQTLVDRLRERGLTIKVTTRRSENGLALLLEDVTPAEPPA